MKMARQGLFANTMGTEAAQRRAELAKERQAYLEGNIYSDPLVNIAAQSQRGMRQAFRDIGQGAATSMLGDQAYQDPILKDALKRDKDRKELMDMFANADTDGDGNVSEAEYKAVAKEFRARGYMAEADEVLKRMAEDVKLGLTKKADLRAEEQLKISKAQAKIQKLKADWETEDRPERKKMLANQIKKLEAETNYLEAQANKQNRPDYKSVIPTDKQTNDTLDVIRGIPELYKAYVDKYGESTLGFGGPSREEEKTFVSEVLSYQKTYKVPMRAAVKAILGKTNKGSNKSTGKIYPEIKKQQEGKKGSSVDRPTRPIVPSIEPDSP